MSHIFRPSACNSYYIWSSLRTDGQTKDTMYRNNFNLRDDTDICGGGRYCRSPSSLALWMESVSGNTELVWCEGQMSKSGDASSHSRRGTVWTVHRKTETMGLEIRRILSLLDILRARGSSQLYFRSAFRQNRASFQEADFRSSVHSTGPVK